MNEDKQVQIMLAVDNVTLKEPITSAQLQLLIENFDEIKGEVGVQTVEELKALAVVNDSQGGSDSDSKIKDSKSFDDKDKKDNKDEDKNKPTRRQRSKASAVLNEKDYEKIKAARHKGESAQKANFFNFNKKLGRFVAFVVRDDVSLQIKTPQFYPTQNGELMFLPEISDEVKKVASMKKPKPTQTVTKEMLKKENLYVRRLKIEVKQQAPQKIVGAYYTVPAKSFEVLSATSNEAALANMNYDDQSLVTVFCIYQDLSQHLKSLFNGEIVEHEEIRCEYVKKNETIRPSDDFTIKVQTTPVDVFDKKDLDENGKPKPGAVASGYAVNVKIVSSIRRSLLTPKNYIALNKYKTVNALTANDEQMEELNSWYLSQLFKKGKGTNPTIKYDSLDPEYASWVTKEGDKITSSIFTTNPNETVLGKALVAKHWYNKNEDVPYEFPIKKKVDNKDTFIRESLLDEETTRSLDEYPILKKILGDNLSVENLKNIDDMYTKVAAETKKANSDPFSSTGDEASRIIDAAEDISNVQIKNLSTSAQAQERVAKLMGKMAN